MTHASCTRRNAHPRASIVSSTSTCLSDPPIIWCVRTVQRSRPGLSPCRQLDMHHWHRSLPPIALHIPVHPGTIKRKRNRKQNKKTQEMLARIELTHACVEMDTHTQTFKFSTNRNSRRDDHICISLSLARPQRTDILLS